MGKSGKKSSKEEASPNFVNDHPDKVHKMATNTPPASNQTATSPPLYGTPLHKDHLCHPTSNILRSRVLRNSLTCTRQPRHKMSAKFTLLRQWTQICTKQFSVN
ncbi:hypothetical protein DPMN_136435 [Dreissena polymorpha]|uniref:Uncharacterized protein n=1 Tax=Dreissena polymorpha TaxID=45954 RepID=A0A9D4JDS4_DREPO|nr:hypothetical protein DPMN_136435 [Dreissena polymorpha]